MIKEFIKFDTSTIDTNVISHWLYRYKFIVSILTNKGTAIERIKQNIKINLDYGCIKLNEFRYSNFGINRDNVYLEGNIKYGVDSFWTNDYTVYSRYTDKIRMSTNRLNARLFCYHYEINAKEKDNARIKKLLEV